MLSSTKTIKYGSSNRTAPISGKLAVITGATSGIGKAYAEYFAILGYDLLITGRRREMIYRVATEIKTCYGVNVEVVIADLCRNEDISQLLQVIGKKGHIEVLVNNAGYALDCRFSEDEIQHQLDMIKVHVSAPLMLIHKLLPLMVANHGGIIINVSSMAAFTPIPSNAMYTGTKSFLRNFTESLYMEVSHYGIQVQCLCPGFTDSDFHRNHNMSHDNLINRIFRGMDPLKVVGYSMHCLQKGQVVCIPGLMNRIIRVFAVLLPRNLYYALACKLDRKFREHYPVFDLAYMRTVQDQTVQTKAQVRKFA